MIQITYPGTGNNSQFTLDGTGRVVRIVELAGGSISETRNFVWDRNIRSEERDNAGNITKKFFGYGEIVSGVTAFLTLDHLGSVRDMTNLSGAIQSQYSYDPFGRVQKIVGTAESDAQFCGYLRHQRSSLDLTRTRAYRAELARFLNRDPIAENGGINLFAYVSNDPVSAIDPSGLEEECCIDWDKVRDAANWGTVAGVGVGGYIGMGGGGLGGGIAGGGVGAIPGGAAGAYAGAAVGGFIGGFGAGAASIAGQAIGSLAMSGRSRGDDDECCDRRNRNRGRQDNRGNTPRNNQAQNRQFKDAVAEIGRRLGKPLNECQKRQLHDAITGQGLGYRDIVDVGLGMFGG